MARFDGPIRTPNHDRIVLSDGTTAYVDPLSRDTVRLSVPMHQGIDAADAIRLAAWLARFHAEHNAQEAKNNG